MATGGYKLVSFSWAGGRTDSALDRCKYILYNFCKAIVDSDMGWDWDDDWVADGSINDYKTMGGHSETYPNIAYVLTNTVDNVVYRAIIALNYYSETALREQDCIMTYNNSAESDYGYQFSGSLYVGLQKGGTITWDATYGYHSNDSNPGQYLKWMALTTYHGSYNGFARQNSSDVTYTYFCLIKGAQLGFFAKSSSWSSSYSGNCLKGFLCGEIFKTTAHSADSNTFGSIYLGGLYVGTEYEAPSDSGGYIQVLSNTLRNTWGGIQFYPGSGYTSGANNFSQIFKADGTLLAGNHPSSMDNVQLRYDLYQVYNRSCNTILSPGGRWTPCYVYYSTLDQSTNGVVPGDSFKGFIDTDLLRGVNPQTAYGEVLGANGEFVHIGGGFAIGWDPNNTVSFF